MALSETFFTYYSKSFLMLKEIIEKEKLSLSLWYFIFKNILESSP